MTDAVFEHDLRTWIGRVYERRASAARLDVQRRVLQTLEREKWWLAPLCLGVVAGLALMPVFGLGSLLTSIGLLYVGAFISGIRTMRRAEQIERTADPRVESLAASVRVWDDRPELGPDERAHLTRMMNLAQVASTPGGRTLLLEEIEEARSVPTLARWPFIDDLEELLQTDAAAV